MTSRARFEVYRDGAGEHRWRLVTKRGRIVADSGEGYATRAGARAAVRLVRELVASAPLFAVVRPRLRVGWRKAAR